MRALAPALAVVTSGLALYFTHSVLDRVVVDDRLRRVALLPAWPTLVAFLAMTALAVAWLTRMEVPRTPGDAPVRRHIGTLLLPLVGLGLLVVPFVPLAPDWIPGLQVLAGPVKWIVWLSTMGLMGWTLWRVRVVHADWLASVPRETAMLGIAALTALVSGGVAARLAGTVVFPAGDEPHYLVMAQSIWRDGDFKIENNHDRGDYREYYDHDLKPDYLTRGRDNEIYSIHPIGLPLVMAPVYAARGYFGVVGALILCAAAAAAFAWRGALAATGSTGAATFAWAAVALTTPFLYNTFTVYPEIVAALAVMVAFTRAVDAEAWPRGVWRWLVVGSAAAALPWLSTKYAPLSATLVLVALLRASSTPKPVRAATAIVAPYGASLFAWFGFFYAFWGTPLPSAPYGDLVQTSLANTLFGVPGLLFDQEYGVLAYAPVYVLTLTGLVAMWRSGGSVRRQAVETAAVFAALLGTVGAFRIWWGGTASPGRPVASGLLLLVVPMAFAASAAPAASARRAGHHLLLWISMGVAATLAVAQNGLLINNGRDGTSTLLEYWSPSWSLWSFAPTFTFHEAPTAWLHSLTWLGTAWAAAWLLGRWRTQSPGAASLAALAILVGALATAGAIMQVLPNEPLLPAANPAARFRLEMLDRFDATVRPVGVIYDPLRSTTADALLPLASLAVTPGLRPAPQPLRVLHNGRFSLPAGRYRVEVDWSGATVRAVPIGLQIGRIEPPWQTWTVQPTAGERWSAEFELPVSANFVALRGGGDVERAIGRITFRPLAVVDEHARPHVPIVLSAWQYGPTTALFHDERASPERGGFWVIGRRTARVTFVRGQEQELLKLRVHSGPQPNRVIIAMRGWSETLRLDPQAPQTITLPDSDRRLLTVDVHPEDGFSPRRYDSLSLDPRYLGAWVELAAPVSHDR